jgi:hypothetical protein
MVQPSARAGTIDPRRWTRPDWIGWARVSARPDNRGFGLGLSLECGDDDCRLNPP